MANEKHAKRALNTSVTFTVKIKAGKVSEVGTFSNFEFISIVADNADVKGLRLSEFRSGLYVKCGEIGEKLLGSLTGSDKKAPVKLF
jgi:hypothetical protein